jgi:hypothetical protein
VQFYTFISILKNRNDIYKKYYKKKYQKKKKKRCPSNRNKDILRICIRDLWLQNELVFVYLVLKRMRDYYLAFGFSLILVKYFFIVNVGQSTINTINNINELNDVMNVIEGE